AFAAAKSSRSMYSPPSQSSETARSGSSAGRTLRSTFSIASAALRASAVFPAARSFRVWSQRRSRSWSAALPAARASRAVAGGQATGRDEAPTSPIPPRTPLPLDQRRAMMLLLDGSDAIGSWAGAVDARAGRSPADGHSWIFAAERWDVKPIRQALAGLGAAP